MKNEDIIKEGNKIRRKGLSVSDIEKKIDAMPDGFVRKEDSNFFRFEKIGDNLLGKLIGIDTSERYGFRIYSIHNKAKDEVIRCHGSKDLDVKMQTVEIGDTVYIEYVDSVETPNGNMKVFNVGVAPKK